MPEPGFFLPLEYTPRALPDFHGRFFQLNVYGGPSRGKVTSFSEPGVVSSLYNMEWEYRVQLLGGPAMPTNCQVRLKDFAPRTDPLRRPNLEQLYRDPFKTDLLKDAILDNGWFDFNDEVILAIEECTPKEGLPILITGRGQNYKCPVCFPFYEKIPGVDPRRCILHARKLRVDNTVWFWAKSAAGKIRRYRFFVQFCESGWPYLVQHYTINNSLIEYDKRCPRCKDPDAIKFQANGTACVSCKRCGAEEPSEEHIEAYLKEVHGENYDPHDQFRAGDPVGFFINSSIQSILQGRFGRPKPPPDEGGEAANM